MDYVSAYIHHYEINGKAGAGAGEGLSKLVRWKKAGFVDGMSLLDYGCGCGAILEGIKDKSDYLGVDIVPKAIEYARIDYPECTFRVITPGKLDTEKKQFVGAGSVFTHTAKSLVDASLSDVKSAMDESTLGIIDILEGDSAKDTIHLSYWKLEDFQSKLLEHGIASEVIDRVKHPNGFEHTYLKISYDHR